MKSVEFCYWLQGFFELKGDLAGGLGRQQAESIKAHLALVFKHEIDPSYSADPKVQAAMQEIHDKPRPKRPRPPEGTVYRC